MSNIWNVNLESEAFKISHCESENDNVWNVQEKWDTAHILNFWRTLAELLMKNMKYSKIVKLYDSFWKIAIHFGYSLHTLEEDYVPEIENILNINCIHCIVRGQYPINLKYSQYQLQEDNIFKIWNILNNNCRRTSRTGQGKGSQSGWWALLQLYFNLYINQ